MPVVELKPQAADQLQILCQVPMKVKIGDKEFEVHPLTFKKLSELKPHIQTVFDKLGGLTAVSVEGGGFIKPILDNLDAVMESVLMAIQIVLRTKKGEEVEKEFLEENLDTLTLGKILGFVIKTCNIGETVKNVVILRAMSK
jgi:hypothetical protein